MLSQLKPIKIWGKGGPNPPKVAIVVAELGLPHEIVRQPLSTVKSPEYLAINPNGRIPAIYDPNTDLTLWESGAIIEYLIERYDAAHKISFPPGSNESFLTKQWLYFQVSGQGPYYGQASWFKKFHPEKVPSALERYVKEINRVTSVLEGHLSRQKQLPGAAKDGPWLVGNRYSYADLSFVSWQTIVEVLIKKEDGYIIDDYPVVKDWLRRILSRDPVKAVMDDVQPVL
jgi:glutathione S-transferase